MYTTQKRNPNLLSKITPGDGCLHSLLLSPEHHKIIFPKFTSQAFSALILGIQDSQESPILDSEVYMWFCLSCRHRVKEAASSC